MKRHGLMTILIALLMLIGWARATGYLYTCTSGQENVKCPKFKPLSLGVPNLPRATDMTLLPLVHPTGEPSLAVRMPFCRNCGYIISRYPISHLTNVTLQSDSKFTSLGGVNGSPMDYSSSTDWQDLWERGDNLCNKTVFQNGFEASTDMMEVSSIGPCEMIRTLKPMTFEQKRQLKDRNGDDVYKLRMTPTYSELSTTYYGAALYPYSTITTAEKYSSQQRTFVHKIRYFIDAVVTSAANVLTQKELLVTVNDEGRLNLEVDLKAPSHFYPDGNCKVISSGVTSLGTDWEVKVVEQRTVGTNGVFLVMESKLAAAEFIGKISAECQFKVCGTTCVTEPVHFKLHVNSASRTENSVSTKFDPVTKQYTGSVAAPFSKATDIAGSIDECVSIGIGTTQTFTGFKSRLVGLKMCSGACGSGPHNYLILDKGVIVDQAAADMVGLRFHANKQMSDWNLNLPGNALLGLSFLTASVKQTAFVKWTFELQMEYSPINTKKRSLSDVLEEENEVEISTLLKTFNLIPQIKSSGAIEEITNRPAWQNVLLASGLVVIFVLISVGCIACCVFMCIREKLRQKVDQDDSDEEDNVNVSPHVRFSDEEIEVTEDVSLPDGQSI